MSVLNQESILCRIKACFGHQTMPLMQFIYTVDQRRPGDQFSALSIGLQLYGRGGGLVEVQSTGPVDEEHFRFRSSGPEFTDQMFNALERGHESLLGQRQYHFGLRADGHTQLPPGRPVECDGCARGAFGAKPADQLA